MNPKAVAVLLAAGTLVLGGGSALIAVVPVSSNASRVSARAVQRDAIDGPTRSAASPTASPGRAMPALHTPAAAIRPSGATPSSTLPAVAPAFQTPSLVIWSTITYSVKSGDTLAGVAQWFKQQGYIALAAVIAENSDPIVPGELISISNGSLSFQRPG